MRIEVDLMKCESNGLCTGVAPAVFQLNDEDLLDVLQAEVGPDQHEAVRQAARLCPKQAITLV
jgi:ferredoxin